MVLVSSASDIPVQSPRTSEISVPADLDKTITELADWLVLIDQMLKSNIVTVGDIEEINKTVSRMKVSYIVLRLVREMPQHRNRQNLFGSPLFVLNSGRMGFKKNSLSVKPPCCVCLAPRSKSYLAFPVCWWDDIYQHEVRGSVYFKNLTLIPCSEAHQYKSKFVWDLILCLMWDILLKHLLNSFIMNLLNCWF